MRDLWPFLVLYKRHKGLLLLGIVLAVVTLAASVGLLALSGWFITATSIAGLVAGTAKSFDFFSPGAGVRGFSIVRIASRYFERLVSHDATFRLLSWLREWFFKRLVPLPLERIGRYRKGDLLNRLVADVDALDQLYLRLVSPVVSAVVIMIVVSFGFFWFSPALAKYTFIVMLAWIVLMPALFYRLGRKAGQSLGQCQLDLRQQVLDHVQGMAESVIYGYRDQSRASLTVTEKTMQAQQQRMTTLDGLGAFLLVVASGSSATGMLWLASGEYQASMMSASVMVLMMFALLAAFEALMPLPGAFQFLSYTRQSAARLKEVLDEPPVIFADQAVNEAGHGAKGRLCFDHVTFRYSRSADRPRVIDHLCLNIPAGQHVALLGKTGSGKSTMVRLLTRAVEPCGGDVLIDGRRIRSFTEKSLYQAITVVPQRTHVFSTTLRGNLLLAAPFATDNELMRVLAETGLDKLGGGNEGGLLLLDRWLGQGGIALSGGEQRRLAIARALLKPAPVLIMDEPTEGLDSESEQKLIRHVLTTFRESTVIMITHKHTMLGNMDRVYLMEKGRVDVAEMLTSTDF